MRETKPAGKRALPGWAKLLIKLGITLVCLWYVSRKIDFKATGAALQHINWLLISLALLLFISSKIVAAYRLNIYFRNAGVSISEHQNLRLYWLGMFYNLFLPGSISGDAYKVILLKRRYDAPVKKTGAAVLLDRFSGLLGLGLILAGYGLVVLPQKLYGAALIAGAMVAILVFYWMIRRWFKDFIEGFWPTLLLGTLVQALQVICVYFIMASLGIPSHITQYVFIFLVSSVVSVLPLTIGGLGIREVVFLEGSNFFGLGQETSVVISLLFYLITLVTSTFGGLYIFRDPLGAQKKDP